MELSRAFILSIMEPVVAIIIGIPLVLMAIITTVYGERVIKHWLRKTVLFRQF